VSGLGRAVRAEVLRTRSTRTWWVLTIVMVVYLAGLAAVMTFSLGAAPGAPMSLDDPLTLQMLYALTPSLGYVFPMILGAMAVTGEIRHQTITPTFLTEPKRGRVLAAKLVVALGLGLLIGAVATVVNASVVAGLAAAQGSGPALEDAATWGVLGRSVLALGIWGAVGVGFGALIRNQIAAIVVVLAFTQLVEPVLRIALGAFEATRDVASYLPGAAGEALAGAPSLFTGGASGELLATWAGALVLLGYAVVLTLLGRLVTFRRDVL